MLVQRKRLPIRWRVFAWVSLLLVQSQSWYVWLSAWKLASSLTLQLFLQCERLLQGALEVQGGFAGCENVHVFLSDSSSSFSVLGATFDACDRAREHFHVWTSLSYPHEPSAHVCSSAHFQNLEDSFNEQIARWPGVPYHVYFKNGSIELASSKSKIGRASRQISETGNPCLMQIFRFQGNFTLCSVDKILGSHDPVHNMAFTSVPLQRRIPLIETFVRKVWDQ